MPAHGDCQFRDEWLVQDKYKEWLVKDGDLRLTRCKFCMKSSMQEFEEKPNHLISIRCCPRIVLV